MAYSGVESLFASYQNVQHHMDEQLSVTKQPHRKKKASNGHIYIYKTLARIVAKVNLKVQFTPTAYII